MTPKEIKNDLKTLSKRAQSIATLQRAIMFHEYGCNVGGSIEKVRAEYEYAISEFLNLEVKYMGLIDHLEPMQKAIIIDHYINAEPLWRTANTYGYTDRHLCRFINDAILNMAKMTGYEEARR